MTSYSGQLDAMWLGIFHDSLLAAIALLVVLIWLSFRRGLDPNQAFIVILPTLVALTISKEMPPLLQNVFIIIPAAIIGYGIVKFFWAR